MPKKKTVANQPQKQQGRDFHIELLNGAQKLAWAAFQQHDVLFLLGPAGTGKTFLSCAFAVKELLSKSKSKVVLTRPIVEAGESLGFLPGDFYEKVNPYMMPMYDCLDKLIGKEGTPLREKIMDVIEIAPLAFMRGRALSNDEVVMTPVGPTAIKNIVLGDFVLGRNGKPTKVTGVYPQGEVDLYKVKFSDNTEVICCGNHLWDTMTLNEKRYGNGFTTKKTTEIMQSVLASNGQKNHKMPTLTAAVEFQSQEVPINGYLLGALLGDGHIGQGVSLTTADMEIIDECVKSLPEGHSFTYMGENDFRMRSEGKVNRVKLALSELGLSYKKSYEKFIPDCYKINSSEVRMSVLQGLLDTDGWICKHRSGNTRIQYCTTSKRLCEDVMFLVRSLGGHAYCRRRDYDESDNHEYNGHTIRHNRPAYIVDIALSENPFRLARKSSQFTSNQNCVKLIKSIEPCGKGEATCISVDAEDKLFLTNEFIVTHNTFDDSVCILDEAQNCSMQQLKLFMTRFGENSKIIITGDPNQSDLRGPVALVQAVRKLRDVNGIGIVEFKNNSIVRHPLIGSILDALAEEGEVDHRSYEPVFTIEDGEEDEVPSYFPKQVRNIE